MLKKRCKDLDKKQFEACFDEGLRYFRFKPEAKLEEFKPPVRLPERFLENDDQPESESRPKRETQNFNVTFVNDLFVNERGLNLVCLIRLDLYTMFRLEKLEAHSAL